MWWDNVLQCCFNAISCGGGCRLVGGWEAAAAAAAAAAAVLQRRQFDVMGGWGGPTVIGKCKGGGLPTQLNRFVLMKIGTKTGVNVDMWHTTHAVCVAGDHRALCLVSHHTSSGL